ncbi:hypothetical protein [Pedobacter sp. MR22-3]|uniref:hypothetical protein n=1 Tax=Pedobacter sp. MR22-3 TaxID=2994552 RepID=UPI002247717B|nr:hypothetical protein [Pedobacter sp. MR22-3]MCX2583803.1 hypothetical protein [Pedobacter sp. MR22-3]
MKKNNSRIWLTAVLLAGTFALQAQELPKPPQPPVGSPNPMASGLPRPPIGAPAEPPRPLEDMPLITLTTIKGTVVNPVANEEFEYNGLVVKTSNGNVNVMFPPHLGEKIISAAKKGASVTITGNEDTNPEGLKIFRLNSIEVNGKLISDTPPVAPLLNESQDERSFNASIKQLNYGLEKNVNGFTLTSGERVSIAPHIAQQLSAQLKSGEKVVVTGFVEPKRPGVLYSQKTTLVRARTLNINGQTFLVR